jgi:hypothetical protein
MDRGENSTPSDLFPLSFRAMRARFRSLQSYPVFVPGAQVSPPSRQGKIEQKREPPPITKIDLAA